jgi:hypothetical protein
MARAGYWMASHSALVQFLLFKYQDRIKQIFNLGIGVAGNEQDYDMLDLAVAAYESLLERAEQPAQRDALDTALRSLRGWKF